MHYFILIRLKQAYRLLQEAGWGLLLVLIVVTAALWIAALDELARATPYTVLALSLLTGFGIQLSRTDRSFLEKLTTPTWKVYLGDLCLVLAPLALFLVLVGNLSAAPAMLTGLVAALFPPGILAGVWTRKSTIRIPFLPPGLFELQAAVRRYPWAWAAAFLLQFGVWHHFAFFLGAKFIGLILLGSTFEYLEPKDLLPADRRA